MTTDDHYRRILNRERARYGYSPSEVVELAADVQAVYTSAPSARQTALWEQWPELAGALDALNASLPED